MRTTIYIPDQLAHDVAKRYHRAKGAEYTISELVQVGLQLVIDSPIRDLRVSIKNHEQARQPASKPALPGLRSGSNTPRE